MPRRRCGHRMIYAFQRLPSPQLKVWCCEHQFFVYCVVPATTRTFQSAFVQSETVPTWYLRQKTWRHGGTSGGNSRSRLFITSYTELLGCDVLRSYMSLSLTFHSRSSFLQRWIYPRFALWGPAEGKKLGDCQVVGASDVFFVRALCCRWFLHYWGNTVAVVYSKLSTDELWMEHLGQSCQWAHDPFYVSWTRSKSYLRLVALMRYGTTEICGQDTRWPVWERMFELQFRIVPRIFLDDLPSCLSNLGLSHRPAFAHSGLRWLGSKCCSVSCIDHIKTKLNRRSSRASATQAFSWQNWFPQWSGRYLPVTHAHDFPILPYSTSRLC